MTADSARAHHPGRSPHRSISRPVGASILCGLVPCLSSHCRFARPAIQCSNAFVGFLLGGNPAKYRSSRSCILLTARILIASRSMPASSSHLITVGLETVATIIISRTEAYSPRRTRPMIRSRSGCFGVGMVYYFVRSRIRFAKMFAHHEINFAIKP